MPLEFKIFVTTAVFSLIFRQLTHAFTTHNPKFSDHMAIYTAALGIMSIGFFFTWIWGL